jgi:hypothetical protein
MTTKIPEAMTMMISRRIVRAFMGILACVSAGYVSAKGNCTTDGQRVEGIRGRVVMESHSGPPNYGETPRQDSKQMYPVLHLQTPIQFCGNEERPLIVKSVQIVPLKPRKIDRRQSRWNGALMRAQSGHHVTAVVLLVR